MRAKVHHIREIKETSNVPLHKTKTDLQKFQSSIKNSTHDRLIGTRCARKAKVGNGQHSRIVKKIEWDVSINSTRQNLLQGKELLFKSNLFVVEILRRLLFKRAGSTLIKILPIFRCIGHL